MASPALLFGCRGQITHVHTHMHTQTCTHTDMHTHRLACGRVRVSAPSPLPRGDGETLTPGLELPAWLAQIPCDEGVGLSLLETLDPGPQNSARSDTAPPWTCSMKGLGLHWA